MHRRTTSRCIIVCSLVSPPSSNVSSRVGRPLAYQKVHRPHPKALLVLALGKPYARHMLVVLAQVRNDFVVVDGLVEGVIGFGN